MQTHNVVRNLNPDKNFGQQDAFSILFPCEKVGVVQSQSQDETAWVDH